MAKYRSYSGSGKSGSSPTRRSGPTTGSVSSARLHQKSGTSNAFGGYTKVANNDGTFRMRKTGK